MKMIFAQINYPVEARENEVNKAQANDELFYSEATEYTSKSKKISPDFKGSRNKQRRRTLVCYKR